MSTRITSSSSSSSSSSSIVTSSSSLITATNKQRLALGDITNAIPRQDNINNNKLKKNNIINTSRTQLLPSVAISSSITSSSLPSLSNFDVPKLLSSSSSSTNLMEIQPPLQSTNTTSSTNATTITSSINTINEERSYMLREIDDIDIGEDSKPITLCSDYAPRMYEIFYENERKYAINPNYLSYHQHINEDMREVLIDWLAEVHLKYKLAAETLYLTVNILDRYLERTPDVTTSKLQLVGITSLLIASKIEEIYPPEVKELSFITSKSYSCNEIIEMERQITLKLEYNLTVPTIYTFLCRYLKAAHADKIMVQVSCYLAESTLQHYKMLNYLPSLIAAKCVHSARMMTNRYPWSPTLRKYTKLDEDDLVLCGNELKQIFHERELKENQQLNSQRSSSQSSQQRSQKNVIKNKYLRSRNGSVAQLPVMF